MQILPSLIRYHHSLGPATITSINCAAFAPTLTTLTANTMATSVGLQTFGRQIRTFGRQHDINIYATRRLGERCLGDISGMFG